MGKKGEVNLFLGDFWQLFDQNLVLGDGHLLPICLK